jgi:hypothetical protein
LTDIDAADISRSQELRLREKAAAKAINLEVGTLRAIPRRIVFGPICSPTVRMLQARDDVGKAPAYLPITIGVVMIPARSHRPPCLA